MFTGPVGPVEVFFFYWPAAVFGNFYWPGTIGLLLASSPGMLQAGRNHASEIQQGFTLTLAMLRLDLLHVCDIWLFH